ncbi:MAG: hypothetical protein ABIH90_00010 [Candidatus Aenigmatarchaeota archaeon]
MKTLLVLALVFVFATSIAVVLAEPQGGAETPNGNDAGSQNTHGSNVVLAGGNATGSGEGNESTTNTPSQGQKGAQMGNVLRIRTEAALADGSKQVRLQNSQGLGYNKTVTTVNGTQKRIEITSAKGTLVFETTGRTPADETRNGVFMERLGDELENQYDLESVEIDPEQKQIRARFMNKNGTEEETEIPETLQVRFQARVQENLINISIDSEAKHVILAGNGIMATTKQNMEVNNGTVYIVTAKEKKAINVLPETASENAKLHANFHTVRAMEMIENNGEIVYRVQGTQTGKLLGLFATELDVESDVDAETGQVRNVKKAWWSFLVF